MRRLELNHKIVELGNQLIAITRQAYNFENLENRNLIISNNIELEKTTINDEVLKKSYRLGSNSDQFERKIPAKYFDNGLLFSGYAVLKSISNTYKLQLVEQIKEFFDNLNENLNKLDVDSYDFTFNSTNYTALKILLDNIWVWPFINFHQDRSAAYMPDTSLLYSRPLFSFKYFLDLIFEKNGWTYEKNHLDIIDNLAFTCNHSDFFFCSYQKTIDGAVSGTITGLETNDFENNNMVTVLTGAISFIDPVYIRLRGNITATSDFIITISSANLTQTFLINEGTTFIDFKTDKFEGSNTITLSVSGTGSLTFDEVQYYVIHSEKDFNLSANPITNNRIKAYDNLLELSQKDLIKEIYKLFGVCYDNNNLLKKVSYFPVKQLTRNNCYDWSGKVIRGSESIDNNYGNYAQKNILKYLNDESIYSKTGEGQFLIDSEILEDETIVIESKFGASLDVTIDSNKMGEMLIYNDTGRLDEDVERNIRLYELYDGGGFTIGKFENLDFKNLIKNYWKNLFDSLNRIRVMTCLLNLNRLDVLGFDNKKTVYISEFNSYFIVLSQNEFIPGKPTQCNLLKI